MRNMEAEASDLSNGWKVKVSEKYRNHKILPYLAANIITGFVTASIFVICFLLFPDYWDIEHVLIGIIIMTAIDMIPVCVMMAVALMYFREIEFSVDGVFISSSAVDDNDDQAQNRAGKNGKTLETGKMELSRIQQIISVPRLDYIKIVSGGEHMEIVPPKNRLDDVVAFLSSYAPSASVDSEER
ncbi:MAG: hypothetical protein K6G50_12640 [bacterium]|nr:hypothetical protein [bacterium]